MIFPLQQYVQLGTSPPLAKRWPLRRHGRIIFHQRQSHQLLLGTEGSIRHTATATKGEKMDGWLECGSFPSGDPQILGWFM